MTFLKQRGSFIVFQPTITNNKGYKECCGVGYVCVPILSTCICLCPCLCVCACVHMMFLPLCIDPGHSMSPLLVDLSLLHSITGLQALILRKKAFYQAVACGKANYSNSQNEKKNKKLCNQLKMDKIKVTKFQLLLNCIYKVFKKLVESI